MTGSSLSLTVVEGVSSLSPVEFSGFVVFQDSSLDVVASDHSDSVEFFCAQFLAIVVFPDSV